MDPKTDQRPLVSAIVPAFNEAKTIGQVLAVLEQSPRIDEIIVVDDGSTDGTAARARQSAARVICLTGNEGKATAMDHGVLAARNEIIFFLDADIRGLTLEMIEALVQPVVSGGYGMYVAIRGRKLYFLNKILRFTPILGGERVLSKTIWNHVPAEYKRNYQIEIALNFFTKKLGQRMGFTVMPELSHTIKERKRGFFLGLYQRLFLCADVLSAGLQIYLLHNLKLRLKRKRLMPPH